MAKISLITYVKHHLKNLLTLKKNEKSNFKAKQDNSVNDLLGKQLLIENKLRHSKSRLNGLRAFLDLSVVNVRTHSFFPYLTFDGLESSRS